MRARWLKPEFFKDRKMGQIGPDAAIVYEALWCMADDGGVAKGHAEQIKGEMLVWWDRLDVPAVRAALELLEASGRIGGYLIGDEQYWNLNTLLKHQGKIHNPSKFRHPRPAPDRPVDEGLREGYRTTIEVGQEEGGPTHNLDTYTPEYLDTQVVGVTPAKLSNALIIRLNQGMKDNPAIGERLTPVPHGHGNSLEAAEKIASAGVDPEFAASYVYTAALRYKPSGRNRQINSLAYCADGLITEWERHQASARANGTSRPAVHQPVSQPKLSPMERSLANSRKAFGDTP